MSTAYAVNTKWNSGAGQWQIYRDGARYVSFSSQQPPGVHMALEAGAEMGSPYDGNSGTASSLGYIDNGVTYATWTGYVYIDPVVYTSYSQSSTHVTFDAPNGGC